DEPLRVKIQTAPTPLPSSGAPTAAILPSAESAIVDPNWPLPDSPAPVSRARRVQREPERVNTQTAPAPPFALGPPTNAVFPSPERPTLAPNPGGSLTYPRAAPKPGGTSVASCLQPVPARANTHAAPTPPYPEGPPTTAVEPSAESATPLPNPPGPRSPRAVSFLPCWRQPAPERTNVHAAPIACEWTRNPSSAPIRLLSFLPPISIVPPRAATAMLLPNSPAPASPPPVSLCGAVPSAAAADAAVSAATRTPDATRARSATVSARVA